jgi:purine nucleoside phosphorylase
MMSNELLISKTRVKTFLKKQNLRVSSDFYDAFNEELLDSLMRAAKRAKSNRRLTVLVKDL